VQKQLDELNKRCISLINSLNDMELEERTLSEFLEEVEMLVYLLFNLCHFDPLF
jgi:hypothetical protein